MRYHRSADRNIRLFSWNGQRGETELSLLLAYRTDGGKPSFLATSGRSVMVLLPGIATPRTAICGFYVPMSPRSLCIDLNRVGTFFANRTTPLGVSYSLDRTQLVGTEASVAFATQIMDLVHDGYGEFLRETGGTDPETVSSLRRQASMHGGNVYDVFTKDELYQAATRFPDLAPIKLYPVAGGDPVYVRSDQIAVFAGSSTGPLTMAPRFQAAAVGGWISRASAASPSQSGF